MKLIKKILLWAVALVLAVTFGVGVLNMALMAIDFLNKL